ncbi:MAG: O-antigen translocase [Bacteroidales bacterium]|nr:O-antigen translocase [Bacteroidales bacterium]
MDQTNNETKSDYRSIFKATSLFGGVKFFTILISIIRSKIVAILIGTTGVGIVGLFNSGTSLIQSITQLGLSQSAVRDVSEAHASGDQARVNRIVTVLRKLVWFTGLLGMLCVIGFSPILSKTSFGNYDYTLSFIFLSVIMLFHQLSGGQNVILQGTRRLKYLARASVWGSLLGLVICVPLYYWLGIKGIVPNLILGAFTAMLLSWYFSRKVPYEPVKVSLKEVIQEGGQMLKMGIAMSVSGILVALSAYILRSFINRQGGIDEVGLFQAGFAIMTTYIGMVFSAMGTDYYPRLSAVNKDNKKCCVIMNQQGEIGILILAPLILVCIVFVPWIVRLLYSERFLGANDYIIWAASGMLFKMASWAISFIFIAKGESKLFMINETAVNVYSLGFQILGYWLLGLKGIGIGYALTFLCYFLQVYIISHKRYGFNFSGDFNRAFLMQLLLLAVCVTLTVILKVDWMKYIFGTLIIGISAWISLSGLEKRMGLLSSLKSRMKK